MKLSPAELARVEGYLNERRGDMVDTLCRLVSIPSVSRDDPDPAHPFGPGCRAALDEMQKICAEKGLVTVSYTHLDVYKRQHHILPQRWDKVGRLTGEHHILFRRGTEANRLVGETSYISQRRKGANRSTSEISHIAPEMG